MCEVLRTVPGTWLHYINISCYNVIVILAPQRVHSRYRLGASPRLSSQHCSGLFRKPLNTFPVVRYIMAKCAFLIVIVSVLTRKLPGKHLLPEALYDNAML